LIPEEKVSASPINKTVQDERIEELLKPRPMSPTERILLNRTRRANRIKKKALQADLNTIISLGSDGHSLGSQASEFDYDGLANLADLIAAINEDSDLEEVLTPIKGRESILLGSQSHALSSQAESEAHQNMVSWSTHEVRP
jgi:hypothetical protein